MLLKELKTLQLSNTVASNYSMACRTPYQAPSGIIEFEYFDEMGEYSARVPLTLSSYYLKIPANLDLKDFPILMFMPFSNAMFSLSMPVTKLRFTTKDL